MKTSITRDGKWIVLLLAAVTLLILAAILYLPALELYRLRHFSE